MPRRKFPPTLARCVTLARFAALARFASLARFVTVVLLAGTPLSCVRTAPFGLDVRVPTRPYLNMPPRSDGKLPALLSQTGTFIDTAKRVPVKGLIPYELNVAFWSDGAEKSRWMALPNAPIVFSPTGEWRFPAGTVFVKNFDLPAAAATSRATRRLETRLLVCDSNGGVYGVVYKWRADGSDADLILGGQSEDIAVTSANGEAHLQSWYYPSRQDCLTCHTANAGGVLGVKTRQLNRSYTYASTITDNQLRTWNHLGLFSPSLKDGDWRSFAALAPANDHSRNLEDRARSYLDANCAQCHRPGGTVANFDARYDTPLADQALINGPVLIDEGIEHPRVIAPNDIWRSIAFMRINTVSDIEMPPLARETIDESGVQLLREWIASLPGPAVLSPPVISPAGGVFAGPIEVSLSSDEPNADVRYTVDGSVPGASDERYEKPLMLKAPTVLRARAFKAGFTRSITEQQVFIIGK